MTHISVPTFDNLMAEGHQALQSEHNESALKAFKDALRVTDGSDEQNAEATHMEAITLRKLGLFNRALSMFFLANTFATSPLQLGRIARDLAMTYIDMKRYKEASRELRTSHYYLEQAGDPTESAATLGFQGRLAFILGDLKKARQLMRDASRQLSGNPVYALNNLVWLMLASPIRRWVLLPKGLWLVARYPSNRTVGALARVLTSLGGMRLYVAIRAKKSQ